MPSSEQPPFWQTKSLLDMSHDEWESICDGCAKCCLTQLYNEDTQQLFFTDVACRLLDDGACRCTNYQNRSNEVPGCMTMDKDNVTEVAEFAPPSCAYRLLLEGKPLPSWHHLVSGDVNAIHKNGHSVQNKVRFEQDIDPDEIHNYIVEWPER